MAIQDPTDKALDLLIGQYQTSTNFKDYLLALAEEQEEITTALRDVKSERYYDNAYGAQLDYIAELVGTSRTIEGVKVAGYFGYYDNQEALGAGDDNNPGALAGTLKGDDDLDIEDYILNDNDLRNWINARILKNSTRCNTEDTIEFFQLVLDDQDLLVEITEPAEATAHIRLHTALPVNQIALVSRVGGNVEPAGVTVILEDDNGIIDLIPTGAIYGNIVQSP